GSRVGHLFGFGLRRSSAIGNAALSRSVKDRSGSARRLIAMKATSPLASLTLAAGAIILPSWFNSEVAAFAPGRQTSPGVSSSASATLIDASRMRERHQRTRRRFVVPVLFESSDGEEGGDGGGDGSPFRRFLSPRIDDPGLPLTDVLLAQIVAPTFQIYWLALNRAPNPSWLAPISSYFGEAAELAPRGSLLAPTLIHGAGLAVCWLSGALAARMFEKEAFTLAGTEERSDGGQGGGGILDGIGRYSPILIRLVQAGAFASGILIVSTQMDLMFEFKRYVQLGESEETDLRLLVATVEVINDIFWEALVIGSWRIIHANFMSNPGNRLKRF
ncbi:hypothetical protein ACHAWF_018131, partial [Thalassiosira exigua]